MKTLLIFLLLFATARADRYVGQIEYSFTSLSGATDPGTLTGWYAYDSDTGDGAFNSHSLTGSLDVAPWMTYAPLDLSQQFNISLTVIAGIPDLSWGCDWGPFSMNFYDDHFNFGVFRPETGSIRAAGVVQMTAPQRVPEITSTAALLLIGLGMLAITRRVVS